MDHAATRPPRARKARRGGFSAIQILDQGLRVYRRHFATFLLIALAWLGPISAITLLAMPLEEADRFFWLDDAWGVLGGLLLLYVPFLMAANEPLLGLIVGLLGLLLIAALSGVVVDLERGAEATWRGAWRVRPSRLVGMGVLSILYLIVVMIGGVAVTCICAVLWRLLAAVVEALDLDFLSQGGVQLLIAAGMLFISTTMLTMLGGGAGLILGLCYVQQPLIQGQSRVGAAVSEGIGSLFRRLGPNLRLCIGGGLVGAALWLALWSWLLALVVAASSFFTLEEDWIYVVFGAMVLTWALTFPLAPIWAALAYRRQNAQQEQAEQLERRIKALVAARPGPPPAALAG